MLYRLRHNVTRAARRFRKSRSPLEYTPQVDDGQFLFIGGLHRSGTSIIHRLLREHPEVSGFSDTGVPEDEGQHLQTVFAPAYTFGDPGVFAFNPRSHLSEASPLNTQDNRDKLLREWGAYYDLDKRVLAEKSPPNLVRSRFFQAMFPRAAFLFVVRHPVVAALATSKWNTALLTELLLHWHVAHAVMLADCEHLRRYKVIRYEDLIASPQARLDEVCDLMGIRRFVPQERVVDHNRAYLERWASEHAGEKELMDSALPTGRGPMKAFGYSWAEPYVLDPVTQG